MELIYKQKRKVLSTLTDVNVEMGLLPTLSVVQDNMCEYFRILKSDGITMVPICNCFFVVIKTKIRFHKFLSWLDEFNVKSELSNKSKVRLSLDTDLYDLDGGLVAECCQEMCAMDSDKRTLRAIESTLLPSDLEVTKTSSLEFVKMNFEFDESKFVKVVKIDSSNLDFYKHTNNLEYVRMMISLVDLDFWINHKIEEFEIHYISESRFGDEVKLYMNKLDNCIYFEIKREDKSIIKAVLTYADR